MRNLPPLLARDYYRQRIQPWVRATAISAAFGLIALILFGFIPG